MSGRGEKNHRSLALTRRGAVQLVLGAALLTAGLVGGWLAPGAAGLALLAGCVTGLAEVLLARRLGTRGPWSRLVETSARVESWVRVNQNGEVVQSLPAPGAGRGLYRQRSVRLSWSDAFGFWRATRVEPSARELRVPPAVSPELLRAVESRQLARLTDASPVPDPTGVRPYERGDGLRQIAWRQSAHHGELMSFERTGRDAPPVLVIADTLGAGSGDELAAATAAVLQGLRNNPDVLLSDGTRALRSPVQQERFCAAVVGERADAKLAEERARGAARLAGGGSERRRVVLVTCEADGELERALRGGPLAGALTVVRAEGPARPGEAREGAAEKGGDVAPEPATREVARPRAAAELAALLACIALALLANASLTSMIYGGAWRESVPALLCAGAAAGSLLASLLRWCGAPRAARVALPLLVAAALVAAGTALALTALDARVGPLAAADADLAVQRTVWDEPLASLATVVTTGSEQLAGVFAPDAAETWDLLVVLMGAGLAALLAMLCSSRSLRPAAALVPLGLSAADQAIMGPGANLAWTWASVALGLALVWLSASARPSPARGATVALLAVALGLGASAVAPSGDFSPWSAGETRVETLVDLSQDLRSRSSARALTYETTASGPVYLRIGVLDSFDGATWRFFGDTADALVDASPLSQAALSGDTATGVGAPVTTVVRSADGAAAPPGTATLTSPEEGTWRAVGCYLAPVTSVASVDELPDVRSALARRSYVAEAAPPEDVLAVPGEALPDGVAQVLAAAEAEGVGGGGFLNQLETTRWLVGLFTDGSFSYSLDAPGGDQGNLSAIGEFLQTRSGYCTHYATAFALLSRELGLPARVALGYAPDPTQGEDGNYVVTMLQLHAWAEVWLDGIGWVGVDVTPAAGGAADPAPEPTSPEEEPDETPDAPAEAPTQPEEQTQEDQPAEKDDEAEGSPFPWLVAVLLALALVAVGGVSVLLARRRRVTTWQAAWARVCRKAWRAGVRWDKSATEDQVADLICARLRDEALSAEVRRTCRNACHERYGGQSAPFKQPPLQAIARTLRRGHK